MNEDIHQNEPSMLEFESILWDNGFRPLQTENIFGGFKGEPSYDEKHYETGIIKEKSGNGYEYFYVKNKKPITNKDRERIMSLKLPPSWNNVWISGDKTSDIQAVGIDSKNRKQYKYNEKHIKLAEREKFLRLYDFIKSLPKLDKMLNIHQKLNAYDKRKVITTMLYLVKELHIRVGKEQYAQHNKSYGISSLKKTHVKIVDGVAKFDFKGKSNQRHHYSVKKRQIVEHLKLLSKLDGEKLFQYIDENNKIRKITDVDLNQYIQSNMGPDFTIKDFRTFAANYYFVKTLLKKTKPTNNNIKKNIINAIKISAKHLGHTHNISKKSYIMNYIVSLYMTHPKFFIEHRTDNPIDILLEILKMYKRDIVDQ